MRAQGTEHPKTTLNFVLFFVTLTATLALVPFGAKPVLQGGALILALLALMPLARARFSPLPRLPAILMGGALLVAGASAIWSPAPLDVLTALPRLVFIFILGLVLIMYARAVPPVPPWAYPWLAAGLAVGIMGVIIIQHTDYDFFKWWRGVDQVQGFVTNKAVGILTLLSPAILMPLFYRPGAGWKILAAGTWGMLALTAATAEGQSSLLALAVMALTALMPLRSRLFFKTLAALIVLGVLCAPFAAIWMFERGAPLIEKSPLLRTASAPQRLEVWRAIAEKALEKPFLGHGFDATKHIAHFNSDEIYQPGTRFSHPHNMALQWWIEFGFLGASLGAAALVTVLKRILSAEPLPLRRLYFMSFASTLSVALIGWGMWQVWWMVLVLLITALNILAGRVICAVSEIGAAAPTNSRATS